MINSVMSFGPGIRIRRWGDHCFALNVDDVFRGIYATKEEAERRGELVLKGRPRNATTQGESP